MDMFTAHLPYLIPMPRRGYEDFRIHSIYHRQAPQPNRGASRAVIERYTHAHKYPKREKCDSDDSIEKCTICLCEFEVSEDVR